MQLRVNDKEKVVIWGTGKYGQQALLQYKNVAYFIDNDTRRKGKIINGCQVMCFEDYLKDDNRYQIIIASRFWKSIVEQLKEAGISNYLIYPVSKFGINSAESLVYNPYVVEERNLDEEEYNSKISGSLTKNEINKIVRDLYNSRCLFSNVQIETINRCNGICGFCPINKNEDNRKYAYMTDGLLEKIVGELSDIEYSGSLALFSNNEPLLDNRIVQRYKYCRERLPKTTLYMYTNGTLLTVELFVQLIKYLDQIVIDNYSPKLELIKPCKKIEEYCLMHPELKNKVTIVIRNPNEILTNRGGDAPNRKSSICLNGVSCVLPFKQLIIRPDGKISLCCNDPLGKETMGDINRDSLLDIWYGEAFANVREKLIKGRENHPHCKKCDAMMM